MQFSKLTPTNLEEEKAIFFANNFQYNPNFIYSFSEKTIKS